MWRGWRGDEGGEHGQGKLLTPAADLIPEWRWNVSPSEGVWFYARSMRGEGVGGRGGRWWGVTRLGRVGEESC